MSKICSILVLGWKRACQLTARLMRSIVPSFLGTRSSPARTRAAARFLSHLGPLQVGYGLALSYIDYSIVFLEFETLPSLFGLGQVTPPPAGGVEVKITSHVLLQVSTYLDNLEVYYTNKAREDESLMGLFDAVFDSPCSRGSEPKNRDWARTRRVIVLPFRAVI